MRNESFIIQSRPDANGCRKFFRTETPFLPVIKDGAYHGWAIATTCYDVNYDALLASGTVYLGSSSSVNLSDMPDDTNPRVFDWRDEFGPQLAELDN